MVERGINMKEIKCRNCDTILEWDDTIKIEGGIDEGYIIEAQLYHCENCGKECKAIIRAPIDDNNINVRIKWEKE